MTRKGRSVTKMSWGRKVFFCLLGLLLGSTVFWYSGGFDAISRAFYDLRKKTYLTYGLKVDSVLVEGRSGLPREALKKIVARIQGQPQYEIDVAHLKKEVEAFDWVKSATVEKRLPHILIIRLEEHQPIARLYHDNKHALLAKGKHRIFNMEPQTYRHLFLLMGKKAHLKGEALLDALAPFKEVRKNIMHATLQGGRRWDLKTKNGILIKLPEKGVEKVLKKLNSLIKKNGILSKKILTIDMRLKDRLILKRKRKK